MSTSVPDRRALSLPVKAEKLAHASLRKAEPCFKARVGSAIARAMQLSGWSLKELAGMVDRDPRQVARWIEGTERPHFDALFAVEAFRKPLVIALAGLLESGVEIDTVIRVRLKEIA